MRLRLNGLSVGCVIGDRDWERTSIQVLRLDVELEVSDAAASSDALADAADYVALSARIRAVLKAAQCRMIERAAYLAAGVCLEDAHVREARVTVTKSGTVAHLDSASAVCVRRRDGSAGGAR